MENDSAANEERVEFSDYSNTSIPSGLEDKTVQALQSKGLIGNTGLKNGMARIALAGVLILTIFYAGWLLGKNDKQRSPAIASTNKPGKDFLLLLYNAPGFVESKLHVKEYGDWMRSLIKNNHIATGEELAKTGWELSMQDTGFVMYHQPVQTAKGRISGFFLIKADDDKKALEIALTCPHIKHNGMIELRPVQSN